MGELGLEGPQAVLGSLSISGVFLMPQERGVRPRFPRLPRGYLGGKQAGC